MAFRTGARRPPKMLAFQINLLFTDLGDKVTGGARSQTSPSNFLIPPRGAGLYWEKRCLKHQCHAMRPAHV